MTSKTQHNPPSQPNATILVGICSHFAGVARRETIRQTWLSDPHRHPGIICRFFIGGGLTPEDDRGDIVTLDTNDRYEYLPQKCFDFYQWAYSNTHFDHLFKCDDDTYLALDRLHTLPDPAYHLVGDPSTGVPRRLAPSGGAGYLLSKQLVSKIINATIPPVGFEDLIFGELALKLGAKCKSDNRLCLHPQTPPLKTNPIISAHWCSIEQMHIFHQQYIQ